MTTSKISLYNKVRPTDLKHVIGQEHVTKVIQGYLDKKQLPKSIILYGPPGTGKTTISRIIAKHLNESDHGIIELDSAEDGGKERIQSIVSSVSNTPMVGEHKTYVFDEAQELTRQAFSSLLKVTEEPPPHVTFIFLTTDFEKIPLSIRSRSECHCLAKINTKKIKLLLEQVVKDEKKLVPDSILNLIVGSSSGSLRNALVTLEEVLNLDPSDAEATIESILGLVSPKKLTKFLLSYLVADYNQLFSISEIFNTDKSDISRSISDLQQLTTDCRLCLVLPDLKTSTKSDVSYFTTYVDKAGTAFDKKKAGKLLDKLYDLLLELESNVKRTTNKDALLSRFIIKTIEAHQ